MDIAVSNLRHLDVRSSLVDAAAMTSQWDAVTGSKVGALQSALTFGAVESALGRLQHSNLSSALGAWRSDLGRLPSLTLGLDERVLRGPSTYVEHIQSKFDALGRLSTFTLPSVDPTGILDSEHVAELITRGWCVPLHASEEEARAIAEQFTHDEARAHERMCQLIRDHIDSIETEVAQECPHRQSILRDAFAAHRDGTFNLSVPIFLAQSDGIWHERCGHNLFGGNIHDVIAAAQGGRAKGGIIERLLQALTNAEWKLRQPRKKRPAGFSDLNRHRVLHGEATDYGTEINSLQAIALLHFSSAILRSHKN
ncbi:hypothetical protein [Candidatus Poriferisodalis multihospitum]|uniref:hypothetical protein n=1 Tax=Candidatus Poriferisodalis multihospitum TaxID=2983191 RepID=UPI002B25F5A3|nr:hypothetical protein [Candidatus Poriferisodalis multihospitum]